MKKLVKGLKCLPETRIREIEEDINSHFTDGYADGVGEETLCEMLGSPSALAKEYVMQSTLGTARDRPTIINVFRVVWAAIGIGMLNLILTLPIIAAIFAVWISIAATAFSFTVTGIAAIIASPLYLIPSIRDVIYVEYPLLTFFVGISLTALGGLIGIFTKWSAKRLVRGLVGYIGVNVDIITGHKKTEGAQRAQRAGEAGGVKRAGEAKRAENNENTENTENTEDTEDTEDAEDAKEAESEAAR